MCNVEYEPWMVSMKKLYFAVFVAMVVYVIISVIGTLYISKERKSAHEKVAVPVISVPIEYINSFLLEYKKLVSKNKQYFPFQKMFL